MLDRRQFTALSLAAASAPFLAPSRARASRRVEDVFTWSVLGKNVHLADGGGGNVIYVPAKGGALLVDTKNPGFGDTLKREAESRGHAITTTINTHHHGDHTGGNYAFTGGGAELIAHASARPRIAAQSERYTNGFTATLQSGATDEMKREAEARLAQLDDIGDAWMPTKTVDRDEDGHRFGDRSVAFMHIGNGHTDNDLILLLEDENLMHFGDLMFNGLHPYCDASAKSSPSGWIRSLKAGMKLADDKTIVVPGHGPVTNKAGIQTQIDYFEQLLESVQTQIDDGKERDEITEMTFPFMEGLGFEQIRPIAIGVAYDELTS